MKKVFFIIVILLLTGCSAKGKWEYPYDIAEIDEINGYKIYEQKLKPEAIKYFKSKVSNYQLYHVIGEITNEENITYEVCSVHKIEVELGEEFMPIGDYFLVEYDYSYINLSIALELELFTVQDLKDKPYITLEKK